jgi:hypothetical protein
MTDVGFLPVWRCEPVCIPVSHSLILSPRAVPGVVVVFRWWGDMLRRCRSRSRSSLAAGKLVCGVSSGDLRVYSMGNPQPVATVSNAHSEDILHIVTPKPNTHRHRASFVVSICTEGAAKLWDVKHMRTDPISTFQGVAFGAFPSCRRTVPAVAHDNARSTGDRVAADVISACFLIRLQSFL